jgi:DNA-binding CsgD family transcriptional regulator
MAAQMILDAPLLQSRYLPVFEAQDHEGLLAASLRFTGDLGFEFFSATLVIDRMACEPEFISIENIPAGYRETFQSRDLGKRHPVGQHCKRSSIPLAWGPDYYRNAGQGDRWEHQAFFGLRHGISLAIHLPKGLHVMVGVDRREPLPANAEELERMTADLQLFAVHAQDAAVRVLLPAVAQLNGAPGLTARELECLRWTMEGKTAWELGQILGIAENTAVRHLHSATRKLDAAGKHQAVLKALRAGLIC